MIVAIALDLGTTTIKAGLLSGDGTLNAVVAQPAPVIVADGGRYESDALVYATVAETVLAECLAQTDARPRHGGAKPSGAGAGASHFLPQTADLVGNVSEVRPPLGLCSQRSSFLLWERASGQPVTPLISWQDDRGAASCADLHASEHTIRVFTGLPLTPYYLAPKLRVLLHEHPAWREKLVSGEWLLGTLDTFLVWRWTGGKCHQTDASMAARTQLMDIHSGQWSPALCALFDIPQQVLPQITPSAGLDLSLRNGLRLQASVGDQSAALVATIAEGKSQALVNLGTGGFVVCYLPAGRHAPKGYLQTLVWQDATQRVHYAAEGTLNSIAAALADYPVAACRVEELACDDIYCLAEPSGLGAPFFRGDLGLTFSAPVAHLSAHHIGLLLLEGIIFRVVRILEDFRREFGLERAYLSGGLANLPCLQQGIAQCLLFSVRPRHGGAQPSGAGAGASHFLPQAADLVGNVSEVHLLAQTDASLNGAARLAAGITLLTGADAERIDGGRPLPGLAAKYARWKAWLDQLLNS
ncbi:MAG: FGGY family carbohydrate kinase [Sideroxyarcus sp.]|nr:FGGY family carbohydrate kinase [Sideroxyarcus sp.]